MSLPRNPNLNNVISSFTNALFRPWILVLALFIFSSSANADQLAFISQKQAQKAYKELSKIKVVYLFCGCCDDDQAEKAQIIEVAYRHTGFNMFYEVVITYKNSAGEVKSMAVDLAYVWVYQNKKIQTVGELMKLKHDPCKRLESATWE